MVIYAVRLHDNVNENDLEVATVMYSSSGYSGPWLDMVTGHPEWCWEVIDALTVVSDMELERKKQSEEDLLAMLAKDSLEWPEDESDESDINQVYEALTNFHIHTPWDEFRKKVLRDLMEQGIETSSDGDTHIERLQKNGDRLLACLERAMDGHEMPEDMQDAIKLWWEEYYYV